MKLSCIRERLKKNWEIKRKCEDLHKFAIKEDGENVFYHFSLCILRRVKKIKRK